MIVSSDVRSAAQKFALYAAKELSLGLRSALCCSSQQEELTVLSRVKSDESIADKLRRHRGIEPVNDFIGLRVVVFHVGLISSAAQFVCAWAGAQGLSLREKQNLFDQPSEALYRAIHLDFEFATPEQWGLTPVVGIEIQITTYLQNFHSLASHALLYKRESSGPVSGGAIESLAELSERLGELDEVMSNLCRRAGLGTR